MNMKKHFFIFNRVLILLGLLLSQFELIYAQRFNEEKVSTSYIRMPLQKLPDDIQTYEGRVRASVKGQFLQDSRSLVANCRDLDMPGYHKVDIDGDIYVEVIFEEGLIYKTCELIKEERSYKEEFKNKEGKTESRYPKYNAFYYKIYYFTPKTTTRLFRRDGTIIKENVNGGYETSENFGEGTRPYDKIPNDNYLSEEPLKKAWDLAKERTLFNLESKGTYCSTIIIHGYCPTPSIWNAEIEIIKEGKEIKYSDYREAVNAYMEGLNYVRTDKIAKINKIIRPDYEKRIASFKKAIDIWEKMLLEPRERKDRMNDKIAANICLNLTSAYLWIGDYNKARDYIEKRRMGSRRDKSEVSSLEAEITAFESQAKANEWRPLLIEDKEPYAYQPKASVDIPAQAESASTSQKSTPQKTTPNPNTVSKPNVSSATNKTNLMATPSANNSNARTKTNTPIPTIGNQSTANSSNVNSQTSNANQTIDNTINPEILNLRPWQISKVIIPANKDFKGERPPFFRESELIVFFPNQKYQIYGSKKSLTPGKTLEEGTWSITKNQSTNVLTWKGNVKGIAQVLNTRGSLIISQLNDSSLVIIDNQGTTLSYRVTNQLPENGEMLGVLDDLKMPKIDENPLANFKPDIKIEGDPAKIHIYRPKVAVRKGTNYDVSFNGKPVCTVGDGDRYIYELYSEGALDFKIKVNGGTKVLESKESILNTFNGLQGKSSINANSNSLNSTNNGGAGGLVMGLDQSNPDVQKGMAIVNTANMLTEATTKITNKDEQLAIQKGQVYYLRVDGLTGNLKLSTKTIDASEDFAKEKRFDGSIQTLKENMLSPIPGMSLWDEVKRQKDEFIAKYEAEQALKAQKRKSQANTNLLTSKPWYFQGSSKIPKEGEVLKPAISNVCYKDNTIQFVSDGKYQVRDGKVKCYGVIIDQDATWEWLPEQTGFVIKKGQNILLEAKIIAFKDTELIIDVNNLTNKTQTRMFYGANPLK
jgi:hypothetical protein